jgi:transposase
MIGPSGMVRMMMAMRPVDFRKGMDGLAALVRECDGRESILRHGLHVPLEAR